ncbi:unnamed protein product [Symbiodinium sp. CCMP2592]|nr:unnamed protein product [Symbiodinium sp. CCMP2592]
MACREVLARHEAVLLLQAARQLLEDEDYRFGELQENLAGTDDLCGGVLAGWRPPWLEQGVKGMDFNENMLHDSATPVQHWAAALGEIIHELWQCAREAGIVLEAADRQPCFAVVLPSTAARDVIEKLVRLGGGDVLETQGPPSRSAVPFCRLIHLAGASKRFASDSVDGSPKSPNIEDARERTSQELDSAAPAASDELLRKQALMAVLGATPAVAVFAHEKGKPEAQPEPERSDEPEAVTEEPIRPIPACAGEFQAALPSVASGGSLPSEIRFLHLSVLQEVTDSHGEAPALILAVMKLLGQDEIWQRFTALDAFCDGLLSQWEPPWVSEDLEGEDRPSARQMSLERLEREEESTVQGWAMALDGFLSFLANLAVAARVQHAFETEVCTPHTVAAGQGREGADAAPSGPSLVSVVVPVVVVPEVLTDWHLEVFGPLLRAFKIFMLSEKAWRADFRGASSVPFSVEASSRIV